MKERSGMPYDVVAFESDENARRLSALEEGIFHRMLRFAWINGSVPFDITALAQLCRVRPSTFERAWPALSKLWVNDPENPTRLKNKKQESERIFIELKRKKNQNAANLKWKGHKTKESADANALQTVCLPTQPNKEEYIVALRARLKAGFERLWEQYPSKDGRKEAEKHFNASVKTDQDLSDIETALTKYLKHLSLAENAWKKPKNGKTWFGNWKDWLNWKEPESQRRSMPDKPVPIC